MWTDKSNGTLLARWRDETHPEAVGRGRHRRSQAIAEERCVQGLVQVYKQYHEKMKVLSTEGVQGDSGQPEVEWHGLSFK